MSKGENLQYVGRQLINIQVWLEGKVLDQECQRMRLEG